MVHTYKLSLFCKNCRAVQPFGGEIMFRHIKFSNHVNPVGKLFNFGKLGPNPNKCKRVLFQAQLLSVIIYMFFMQTCWVKVLALDSFDNFPFVL